MGDEYWNSSLVKKNVSQQAIFDNDENDALDRFRNQSNPVIEGILDSSRSTPTITGATSARPTSTASGAASTRHRPTSTANNPTPQTTTTTTTTTTVNNPPPQTTTNALPKANIPTPQVPRNFESSTESTRFGRSPASASSTDSQSSTKWLPEAEEYPDQSVKDGSTQFNQEMEILCRKLLENKSVKLDDIRAYDKKASLLRTALSFNTPSVTVPVMIFLENSLSRPLFYELIKQHPAAVKNYINMAKLKLENDYHIAMLKQFGKNEDVAMIRLRQASQTNDINTRMAILDQAATELGSHPWWHLQVAEQRLLLLKQRESPHLQTHRTVLETYKAVYKEDFLRLKSNRNTNKLELDRSRDYESTFHMTPEMIMCAKLSSIMHCGLRSYYNDFVHQAIHQGIFGKKYIVAPEYLADMVNNWVIYSGEGQEKASERTEQFLKMIVDPAKRLYFAEKFKNYEVAIDTIANVLRDRFELENLRKRMPRDHPAYNQATALLENTKWRN